MLSVQPSREHDAWLRRLAQKYGMPRALLARHLNVRGALEYEIAQLISDVATARAHELFTEERDPPASSDLFDRAVRGVYARLQATKAQAEEEERMRRYAETDDYLRRLKAGEDI